MLWTCSLRRARSAEDPIFSADADLGRVRDVDEEAAGEGDLGGYSRALGRDRLLGDLNQNLLAALERFLDGRGFGSSAVAVASIAAIAAVILLFDRLFALFVVILVVVVFRLIGGLTNQVGSVEEGALLGAYVDECGLDAGEYGIDAAEINVTDHASVVWTVCEELNELPVLQNRDPRFARSRVDEDFSFHCCRLIPRLGDSTSKEGAVQKSPRGRVTGPRYDFLCTSPSALPLHVSGTRESREYPMHWEQQSVPTIYRQTECFRNGDNNLRAPLQVNGADRRQTRYVTRRISFRSRFAIFWTRSQ